MTNKLPSRSYGQKKNLKMKLGLSVHAFPTNPEANIKCSITMDPLVEYIWESESCLNMPRISADCPIRSVQIPLGSVQAV